MPRLIDKDKAKEVITYHYSIHTNIQRIALEEAFSRVPTVEAIQVEWLLNLRSRYLEANCPMSVCVVNEILNLWEKENK